MMSKEKRRVPKLRFPGFTEDWEQRKFGEIMTFLNGRAYKQDELLGAGKYKVLRVGNFYTNDSWYYSNLELDDKYYAMNGDLLYTWSATFGPHIWKGEKVIYHYHIWKLVLQDKIDKLFALQLLEVDKANIMSDKNGSTMVHITKQGMENKQTILPISLNEQKQIAKFLSSMDKVITLHQRKLDKLQATKKALLQEMFPEEGQDKPKRRFKGFTDAWKQRKLSELATMNARIGWQNLRTSEFLDSGDYLLITGTDFDNGRIKYSTCHYVEKKRFDQDTKIQLSTGSILITKDGTLGKVALVEELPKPATLNAGVFNVRVKDDAFLSYKYLYHYLKAPFSMKYVTANATGGTIKHLNQSILVDFPIPIAEKHEQDKITKLLDSLESIITLHQRKLDKLKNLKQAYLNEMFV